MRLKVMKMMIIADPGGPINNLTNIVITTLIFPLPHRDYDYDVTSYEKMQLLYILDRLKVLTLDFLDVRKQI